MEGVRGIGPLMLAEAGQENSFQVSVAGCRSRRRCLRVWGFGVLFTAWALGRLELWLYGSRDQGVCSSCCKLCKVAG